MLNSEDSSARGARLEASCGLVVAIIIMSHLGSNLELGSLQE